MFFFIFDINISKQFKNIKKINFKQLLFIKHGFHCKNKYIYLVKHQVLDCFDSCLKSRRG